MSSPTQSAEPGPRPAPPTPADFQEQIAGLQPVFELESLVGGALTEMGLGDVVGESVETHPKTRPDFCVLHFVILPQRSAWIDFVLETDRASALAIYALFSGLSEAEDTDLEDMLRETMNLIHGALKVAFKKEDGSLIIPVVPQSVDADQVLRGRGGLSHERRYLFRAPGLTLRLTMVARIAPITRRQLRDLRLANVLVEALCPDENQEVVLIKSGTMLNERTLEKVLDIAEFDTEGKTLPVIDPSPLAATIGLR